MSSNGNGVNDELHLVMFPYFAFGHISPFVQLSNKLSSSHAVKISFFTPAGNVTRVNSMLNSTATTTVIPLTLPEVPGLPAGIESTSDTSPAISQLLVVALDLMQPQIKNLLKDLKPHFVLFDFAQGWLPLMASELGIKSIYFSVFTAVATAFLTVPARVAGDSPPETPEEIKKSPPGFPGVINVKTFEARDFLHVFKSYHGTPSVFDRLMKGFGGSDAILIKSCNEMEESYIDYVGIQFEKPILLVGPVVPEPPEPHAGQLDQVWANWLDRFPARSVIYCSFGSETFLTDDQILELALGLELTGLPFFLVLNFPVHLASSDELARTLPPGFTERVKGKGIVHSGWVQQRDILAHDSVGCYVNHGGFSSVMEALVNDCQLVMIPMRGDQLLNSKLVAVDWRAGVEVNRRDEDGYFGKEDVFEAVKSIMIDTEGEKAKSVRENHKKWKEFLENNEIQNKYVTDLVQNMKALSESNIVM